MDPSFDYASILAARGGDRDAFAQLVTRYRGLVSSISLATVRNVATSEDVAQEVFLTVWRDLGSLRNPSSFLPWLRQLTRHRALDAARSRRRRERRVLLDDTALEAAADPGPNAGDAVLQEERTRALVLALDALPEDARDVITLYYREGQSIEQVARLLGLRADTAKKRLSRARAALREEVLAHFSRDVATTAPGERFTSQVLAALPPMSPAAAVSASKGLLYLLKKWALLATTASALVPLLIGVLSVHYTWRRDMLQALDEQERKQLRWVGLVTLLNYAVFALGVAALGPRVPGSHTRLWLGTAHTLAFTAVHLAIYFGWRPRVLKRRRRAEALTDPGAAVRHAREARRARWSVLIASTLIAGILMAAWIRG